MSRVSSRRSSLAPSRRDDTILADEQTEANKQVVITIHNQVIKPGTSRESLSELPGSTIVLNDEDQTVINIVDEQQNDQKLVREDQREEKEDENLEKQPYLRTFDYSSRYRQGGGLGSYVDNTPLPITVNEKSYESDFESTFGYGYAKVKRTATREVRKDFKYSKYSCLRNRSNCLYGIFCPCVIYGLIMQKLYNKVALPVKKSPCKADPGRVRRLDTVRTPMQAAGDRRHQGLQAHGSSRPGSRPMSPFGSDRSDRSVISIDPRQQRKLLNRRIGFLWGSLMTLCISFYFIYIFYDIYNGVGDDNESDNHGFLYLVILGMVCNAVLILFAKQKTRRAFGYDSDLFEDCYDSFFCWFCSLWQMSNEVRIQKELRFYSRKYLPASMTSKPINTQPKSNQLNVPTR